MFAEFGFAIQDTVLDEIATQELNEAIVFRQRNIDPVTKKMHPISESEYAELMARLSIETDRRRGKLTTALDEAKVSTSQKRIQKKAKITFCPAQDMTVARTKALLDVRPSFLWACFCLAFSAHLPGIYKWNADGTTFEINTNGTGEVYAIIRQKDDHSPLTSQAQLLNLPFSSSSWL